MSVDWVPIQLPSGCHPYADVNPDNIYVRTFRGKEEQIIAEMQLSNPKKKMLEVMKNIVKGIDPLLLTSGDVAHILLWEGINSYDKMFPADLTCQHCYDDITVRVDLGTINSKDLDEKYKPGIITLSNGVEFNIRLQTMKDEIALVSWSEKGKSTYLYALALTMDSKETDGPYDTMMMLEKLPVTDIKKIKRWHAKHSHGPDYLVEYECPVCEEVGKVFVPFRFEEIIQESATSETDSGEEFLSDIPGKNDSN